MSQVFGSISALAPHVSSTDVIVGKSTVPVGTADEIVDQLKNTAASGVDVVWNPEFLREGFAVQDTLKPDRLVVGVASERAEQVMRSVYAPLIADGVPFPCRLQQQNSSRSRRIPFWPPRSVHQCDGRSV